MWKDVDLHTLCNASFAAGFVPRLRVAAGKRYAMVACNLLTDTGILPCSKQPPSGIIAFLPIDLNEDLKTEYSRRQTRSGSVSGHYTASRELVRIILSLYLAKDKL